MWAGTAGHEGAGGGPSTGTASGGEPAGAERSALLTARKRPDGTDVEGMCILCSADQSPVPLTTGPTKKKPTDSATSPETIKHGAQLDSVAGAAARDLPLD